MIVELDERLHAPPRTFSWRGGEDIWERFHNVPEREWKSLFGPFKPEMVTRITNEIALDTKYERTPMLDCRNQVLLFLHVMSNGCPFTSSAALFKVGPCTARKYFWHVLFCVRERYLDVIRLPNEEERDLIKMLLYLVSLVEFC